MFESALVSVEVKTVHTNIACDPVRMRSALNERLVA